MIQTHQFLTTCVVAMSLSVITLTLSDSCADDVTPNSKDATKSQTLIRISTETTRITKPLDNEGYVDYVQAINDLTSAGVTPENNFEVIVRQVMPKGDVPVEHFEAIGIPVPEDNSLTYQDFISFCRADGQGDVNDNALFDEHTVVMSKPWTAADHPRAAAWVATSSDSLDRLVEGSKRTKYYAPYLSPQDDEEPMPRMLSVLRPSVMDQREIARGLSIRAMGRMGSGDLNGAWSDVQAIHRSARHVSSGATLIEALVGMACDAIAFQAEQQILSSPDLTDEQVERFLTDLQALKPQSSISDKIDIGERFMGLDAVSSMARLNHQHGLMKMLQMINQMSDAKRPDSTHFVAAQGGVGNPLANMTIDWNVTLEILNQWYDKMVTAANEPDFDRRKILFEEIEQDLVALKAEATDSRQLLLGVASFSLRKKMGRSIGNILVALLIPAVNTCKTAEDRNMAQRDVMRTAFAIEKYRRGNGTLPTALEPLKPFLGGPIPSDPLSGKPLLYRHDDHSCVLYSVGDNGVDDGGRSREDAESDSLTRPNWDDIVVRVGR